MSTTEKWAKYAGAVVFVSVPCMLLAFYEHGARENGWCTGLKEDLCRDIHQGTGASWSCAHSGRLYLFAFATISSRIYGHCSSQQKMYENDFSNFTLYHLTDTLKT